MIKLLVPALIGGRLIPAETVTAAPKSLEEKLISAGNARREPAVENPIFDANVNMTAAEVLDLAKRAQKLKLDLPDDLTNEQVREAVENAEKSFGRPAGSAEADAAPGTGRTADGKVSAAEKADGLKLGRVGVQAE